MRRQFECLKAPWFKKRRELETADIVIVGGGLIGASIAFRLAQAGRKVTVVDRGEPGREASSAAAGMLAAQMGMEKADALSELRLESRKIYPEFVREIEDASGTKIEYHARGMLEVARSEQDLEGLGEKFTLQKKHGLAVEKLAAGDICGRGAGLDPAVRGGLFFPEDHWLDNEALSLGVVQAARNVGARFFPQTEIHKAELTGGSLKELASATRRFSADHYVLAAGCWSGELTKNLGLHVPVHPSRGQMMEFQSDRKVEHAIWEGHCYVVPREGGRLLVGATIEDAGFDKSVTAAGLEKILSTVIGYAPWLREARFRRAWAGLRPDSADHWPILGKGRISNLVFATGHFRSGILLAPITARLISELILDGSVSHPLYAFRPDRFSTRESER